MKLLRYLLIPLVAVGLVAGYATATSDSQTTEARPRAQPGIFAEAPTWSQDFSEPLDTSVFTPEVSGDGGGNGEQQFYTADNAYTRDGKLVIEAKRVSSPYKGKNYTSARLTTQSSFTPTYGRFVWKGVTLPTGVGTWPALWLYPVGAKYQAKDVTGVRGGSDETLNGELDVMEWVGADPTEVFATAHSYVNYPDHDPRTKAQKVVDPSGSPHDYWLEWTPSYVAFGVDKAEFYRVTKQHNWGPERWPYDQPYYLIMNVAMGGSWGGYMKEEDPKRYPDGIDPKFTDSQMRIDGVEYYPLNQ
jgi:beta-glucanase (GH16 family)